MKIFYNSLVVKQIEVKIIKYHIKTIKLDNGETCRIWGSRAPVVDCWCSYTSEQTDSSWSN